MDSAAGISSLTLRPIGVFRSPQRVHHDAPRQPRPDGEPGVIEVFQGLQNCLHDLSGFSHLWVLFWCHRSRGWKAKVTPPRDRRRRGLFATRAPNRPNPIGLSCLRLLGIEGRRVQVGGHDLLEGTPILDLKPYLPYCDSVPGAAVGYVDQLPQGAGDHREWWVEKGLPPPRVYGRRPPAPAGRPLRSGSRR